MMAAEQSLAPIGGEVMRKLTTLFLGLAFALGVVSTVSFAQDKKDDTKKEGKKKKGKKKDEEPKKGGK
jgi:hypothetical protein